MSRPYQPDADEPPNQCSGCDGSGVNADPDNPGERVECDVCWGEGDEERHKQQMAEQSFWADMADAASY